MDDAQPSKEAQAYRSFRDGYEKQIRGEVKEAMEGVIELTVPLSTGVEVGREWGDLIEIDF